MSPSGDETALVRAGEASGDGRDEELPDPGNQPDSLAFIQHSAGTTGLQKGVALTHAAVLRQLESLVQRVEDRSAIATVFTAGCRSTMTWD